eukprot:scpid67921/ scgid4861/ 
MATAIHQVGSSVSDVSDAATVCHQSWRTQWHWCAFTLCQGRSRHHDAFLAVPHETRTPWSAAVNAPVAQQMKAEEGDPLQRCLFYTQSGTLIFTCVHVERNTNVQTGRQYTCADWQTCTHTHLPAHENNSQLSLCFCVLRAVLPSYKLTDFSDFLTLPCCCEHSAFAVTAAAVVPFSGSK